MKIANYIIRFLLCILFGLHGIEKLFTTATEEKFTGAGMDQAFVDFYLMLDRTGYLQFVGLLQLCCSILLVFSRTYLLGAVMLVPLILCLLATHVFMSHNLGYILFDSSVLALNLFLIYPATSSLKEVFLKPKTNWI